MILKRLIPILLAVPLLAACPSGNPNGKMPVDVSKLPRQIYSGEQGPFHVQGIAVDLDRGYMYFSFTTTLLKTNMQGNLLGSVEGMTGHLGCMTTDGSTLRSSTSTTRSERAFSTNWKASGTTSRRASTSQSSTSTASTASG